MSYDMKSIVLMNIGKYGRNALGNLREHPLSINHIPFSDHEGFRYLDVFYPTPIRRLIPKMIFALSCIRKIAHT